jgi:hypothetical protein
VEDQSTVEVALRRADTCGEMTASRTCRACGAELRGDVTWCLRCYAPVRQLTPREPQLPTVNLLHDPDEGRERSRWKGGVNTFGPFGRIVVTVIVLAFAPWSTNVVGLVVAWPAYLVLAGVVLAQTWKKDDVVTTDLREIAAMGRSSAPAVEPAPVPTPAATIVAWTVITAFAIVGAIVWFAGGSVARGALGICASLAALVLAVRWLTRD